MRKIRFARLSSFPLSCSRSAPTVWVAKWSVEEGGWKSGFLLRLNHRHESFLDCVGGLGRTQAQRERFVQCIAFANEVICLFAEFLPRFLEFIEFLRLQCANHIKSGLILKLLKVHL